MLFPAAPPLAFVVACVAFSFLCGCALVRSLCVLWRRKQTTVNSTLLMAMLGWDVVSLLCFATVAIATAIKSSNCSRTFYTGLHLSTVAAYVLVVVALAERVVTLKKTLPSVTVVHCDIFLIVTATILAVALSGAMLFRDYMKESLALVLHTGILGVLFLITLLLRCGVQKCVLSWDLGTEHPTEASVLRTTRVNAVTGTLSAMTLFALFISHITVIAYGSNSPESVYYAVIIITMVCPATKPFIWCAVSPRFKDALVMEIDVSSLIAIPCGTHKINNNANVADASGGRFSYAPSSNFTRVSENRVNMLKLDAISLHRMSINVETKVAHRFSTMQDWRFNNKDPAAATHKRQARRSSLSSISTFSSFEESNNNLETDAKPRRRRKTQGRRRRSFGDSPFSSACGHQGPVSPGSLATVTRALSSIEENEMERLSKISMQSCEFQSLQNKTISFTSPTEILPTNGVTGVKHLSRKVQQDLFDSTTVFGSSSAAAKKISGDLPPRTSFTEQPANNQRISLDIPVISIDDMSNQSLSESQIKESPTITAKERKVSLARDLFLHRMAVYDTCFDSLPGAIRTPTLPNCVRKFSYPPKTFHSPSMSSLSLESIDPTASISSLGLESRMSRRLSECSGLSTLSLKYRPNRWSLPATPDLVDVHDQSGVFIGTYIKQ